MHSTRFTVVTFRANLAAVRGRSGDLGSTSAHVTALARECVSRAHGFIRAVPASGASLAREAIVARAIGAS